MENRQLFTPKEIQLTLKRLALQLIEEHVDFSNTVLIGVQPRGPYVLQRLLDAIYSLRPELSIETGILDVTFYRDDFRMKDNPLIPSVTKINTDLEGKRVVLVDDVLFTGRTIRSAMDALLDYGRPNSVSLMVLIDRRFKRELPVKADFVGRRVDTMANEKVIVKWNEMHGSEGVWIEHK